jgi:hypothetical protein
MQPTPPATQQFFNNADSYAQCFDEAWRAHRPLDPQQPIEKEQKLGFILEQVADHPFARESPARAREVAEFRLRLLGL